MSHWLLDNSKEMDAHFRKKYGRPMPWCEPVDAQHCEWLAATISRRIQLPRETTDLAKVLATVWEKMPGRKIADANEYGGTGRLDEAVGRFGVPKDGTVVFLDHSYRDYVGEDSTPRDSVLRLRMKDLLEFHQSLWHGADQVWAIDEDAN